MKAFILAAGFGTRLWPLTEDRSKPALPFNNRPLIAYSVEYLASHGIRDIIINLHHQPESITRALGDGSDLGAKIEYSLEEQILGTSGAIDRVREQLSDEDFVVINGKIVTDIDLTAAIKAHRRERALATLVLKVNAAREHFSIVEIDQRGWVSRFAGFPEPASESASMDVAAIAGRARPEAQPLLMFTGIQVLSPRIFEYVPRARFSHSTLHVYPQAIEAGEAVIGHIATGNWYEMSTLGRYFEASLLLMRKERRSVLAGAGCSIEENAIVEHSVLWDRVTVERDAIVRQSVLADGVHVPRGAIVERVVVVRREAVSEIERGKVVGDNLIIPF
ncbi:MAG TPA: NDP-sugar synthase [Blastocatellia bacterium]|nr:NDP-sugar synthase [Blastocatellia bacterium]